MFYRDKYYKGKWGVVDTSDGIVEYYKNSDIASFNITIASEVPFDVAENLTHRMNNKLIRLHHVGDVVEFFRSYTIPRINMLLDKDEIIAEVVSTFDYLETAGFIVFALKSSKNRLVLYMIDDYGNFRIMMVEKDYLVASKYPAAKGYFFNRKYNLDLDENTVYLIVYSKDKKMHFIELATLTEVIPC